MTARGIARASEASYTISKKIELAVSAHVRHRYTDYDKLLRQGYEREEARNMIRPTQMSTLLEWRDQQKSEEDLETIMREVITIHDSEEEEDDDEDDDDDEYEPLPAETTLSSREDESRNEWTPQLSYSPPAHHLIRTPPRIVASSIPQAHIIPQYTSAADLTQFSPNPRRNLHVYEDDVIRRPEPVHVDHYKGYKLRLTRLNDSRTQFTQPGTPPRLPADGRPVTKPMPRLRWKRVESIEPSIEHSFDPQTRHPHSSPNYMTAPLPPQQSEPVELPRHYFYRPGATYNLDTNAHR